MKNIVFMIALVFVGTAWGQVSDSGKVQEIVILTSAECGSCKKILEDKLNYTKGIRYAELDVATKKLKVAYAPKKISADEIRKVVSETGYDADDVPANVSSQQSLPACCQPGGMK